jgi:putative ABC transport system permease protein
MKYLPLLWRTLFRRKVRTVFTLLAVLVAFTLFGFLAAIGAAFSMGVELAGNERLVMIHKVSLIQLLPESYLERIRATPGVVDACSHTYFGGIYQDPKNFFMQIPVDPECMLRMYPEFTMPEEQKKAWIADRQGAIVGRQTAAKFGWKVGDRIPLQATIWRKKDDSSNWEFNLDGIYSGTEQGTDETQFFFHYKYFDESRLFGQGNVGWYVVRIANASQAPELAAKLDEQFANSPAETKTTTEKAFVQAFANQVGNIALIVRSIIAMAFFIILLVTANTMAESVRERTGELAVLKTLGFSDGLVLALVLAESCAIAGVGGLLGLGLAAFVVPGIPTGNLLQTLYVPKASFGVGLALVVGLGVVSGIFPALRAMRLRIVDALRRV